MLQDDRSSHFLPDIVTECDITECNVQPDGRLAVQCIGVRRLHTVRDSELDGYRICHFDKAVQDAPLPAGDLPDPIVVRVRLRCCKHSNVCLMLLALRMPSLPGPGSRTGIGSS